MLRILTSPKMRVSRLNLFPSGKEGCLYAVLILREESTKKGTREPKLLKKKKKTVVEVNDQAWKEIGQPMSKDFQMASEKFQQQETTNMSYILNVLLHGLRNWC